MMDQDWWKTWFHKLNKDGHHELLRLYLDLKGKNPQHFYNLMDELWKLNHGTVNFYNKKDHNAFVKTQLELFR